MSESISIIRYRAPDDDAVFVEFLGTVAEEDGTRWVLHLQPRAFLGSAAIGALIRWQKRLQDEGGMLVLAQAGRAAERVVRMLGLEEVLQVFESELEATAFLAGGGGSHKTTVRVFAGLEGAGESQRNR
jgi:anti-anti-sigma factor